MSNLRVSINATKLIEISVRRQNNGTWRATGENGTSTSVSRQGAIYKALFKELVTKPRFRRAMREHRVR